MRILGFISIIGAFGKSELKTYSKMSTHKIYKEFVTNSESKTCSNVGKVILEKNGNAMDAAISTAICIGIVNAFSSGIGGGGFFLIRRIINGEDEVSMIDFRESAPSMIEIDKLQTDKSKEGAMSIAIPGEVLGFYEGHKKYGKLPWKELFEENIEIAKGFRASKTLVIKMKKNEKYILQNKGLREIYTKNEKLKKEGDIIKRENYARTLETISKDPMSFYRGELAKKIVKIIKSMGGIITENDLNNYKVYDRGVLKTQFKEYDVYTTNLPSSGILVIEALNLLEHVNFKELKKLPEEEKLVKFYKTLIHVLKSISIKRGELGDPEFIKNSDTMLRSFVEDENFEAAKDGLKYMKARLNYTLTAPFVEDHGTTHLEVVDSYGMIVQITSTINLEFGSKIMDPDTGIVFNNEINDFYIPNARNAYDLPKMLGNILKKGKRPVSSAAPLLLIKADEIIVIGATGGSRIPSAIIGTLGYWQLGKSLEEAVSSIRIHNQLSPNITYVEKALPKNIWRELVDSGEKIEVSELNSIFTSVQAIEIKDKKGRGVVIHAISDYRKDGKSAGK